MWKRSSLVCSHPKGFHMCNKLFIVWVIVLVPISADARSKTGLHFCLLQILPNLRMFWWYPLVTNLVFFKELLPEDMSLIVKNEVPLCSIQRYNAFYFHFFTQTTFCIKCHFTYTNYSSPCRKRRFAITLQLLHSNKLCTLRRSFHTHDCREERDDRVMVVDISHRLAMPPLSCGWRLIDKNLLTKTQKLLLGARYYIPHVYKSTTTFNLPMAI